VAVTSQVVVAAPVGDEVVAKACGVVEDDDALDFLLTSELQVADNLDGDSSSPMSCGGGSGAGAGDLLELNSDPCASPDACDGDDWFAREDVYLQTLAGSPSGEAPCAFSAGVGMPAAYEVALGEPEVKRKPALKSRKRQECGEVGLEEPAAPCGAGVRKKKAARVSGDATACAVAGNAPATATSCSLLGNDASTVLADYQQMLPASEPRSQAISRALADQSAHVLKAWMLSPEHVDYPYPTDAEKVELAAQAGVTLKQLSVWFTNARKRLWIPLRQMLGKPTPSYVDACLQRKVNNVADIVSRILPVGAAPAAATAVTVVEDAASSDTFSSVTLRPEELVDLKASSAALASRKVRRPCWRAHWCGARALPPHASYTHIHAPLRCFGCGCGRSSPMALRSPGTRTHLRTATLLPTAPTAGPDSRPGGVGEEGAGRDPAEEGPGRCVAVIPLRAVGPALTSPFLLSESPHV
jgi:hypothetical protein